jgi:hypothetical protein
MYSFTLKKQTMKKILILLFSAGLATAAFAQPGYRNDSRSYDNSYQSSPYAYNDQYRNGDRYDNSQWGDHNRFDRDRRRMARERYEYEMMMRRRQAELYHQRSYYPYGYRKPSLQIRIGIGGHRY